MSEIFTATMDNISVSAAQDLMTVAGPANKKLVLLAVELAANGQTTVNNYPIRIKRAVSGFTPGSGGSAVTPHNANPNGANSGSTITRNNTTAATGTIQDYVASQFNPINGYYWATPTPQEDSLKFDLSDAIIIGLDTAPAAAINVSMTVWWKEI